MDDVESERPFAALSFGQVAAALSALRASNSPTGLARAVGRLLTGAGALCCRVDRLAPATGRAPLTLTTLTRSVSPHRADLFDAGRDLGTAQARSGSAAVIEDADRELTWVVVPLVAQRRTVGALRVALEGTSRPAADVLAFLHHIGSSLGLGLSAAELHEQAERVSQSLQASLLPAGLESASWFRLAARYAPATAGLHVGGDWYDSQLLGTELAISVGDVAGHGVEAAARMGQLRSAITALRLLSRGPDELILHLHRLCDLAEHFATAICARVTQTGRLLWSSAGHFSPVVARADGSVEYLPSDPSPPLGVGERDEVALNVCELSHGDTVVLFTDGLVERRDESLEASLGELLIEIERCARSRLDPDALVDQLLAARQDAGPTNDDIAVMAVQIDLEAARRESA